MVYECQDDKCEIKENFFLNRFYLYLQFIGDFYNLQKDNPISSNIFTIQRPYSINDFFVYIFHFEESKCTTFGFFGNKNESILIPKIFDNYVTNLNLTIEKGNAKYKVLGQISFLLTQDNWIITKEQKNQFGILFQIYVP